MLTNSVWSLDTKDPKIPNPLKYDVMSHNCFLEFDSAKEARAPVVAAYNMEFGVIDIVEEGCMTALIRRIRSMF